MVIYGKFYTSRLFFFIVICVKILFFKWWTSYWNMFTNFLSGNVLLFLMNSKITRKYYIFHSWRKKPNNLSKYNTILQIRFFVEFFVLQLPDTKWKTTWNVFFFLEVSYLAYRKSKGTLTLLSCHALSRNPTLDSSKTKNQNSFDRERTNSPVSTSTYQSTFKRICISFFTPNKGSEESERRSKRFSSWRNTSISFFRVN